MTDQDPTSEILVRKLKLLFPTVDDRERARSILSRYGIESHEKEVTRVCLAALKRAGPDLARLESQIGLAKKDYRDLLAYAKYPGEMHLRNTRDPATREGNLLATRVAD